MQNPSAVQKASCEVTFFLEDVSFVVVLSSKGETFFANRLKTDPFFS